MGVSTELRDCEKEIIVKKLGKWPNDKLFPVVDLWRLLLAHPSSSDFFKGSDRGTSYILQVLNLLAVDINSPLGLCAARTAAAQSETSFDKRELVLNGVEAAISSTNKHTKLACASVLLNMAIILYESSQPPKAFDEATANRVLQLALTFLSKVEDEDARCRAMLAIGTLLTRDSAKRPLSGACKAADLLGKIPPLESKLGAAAADLRNHEHARTITSALVAMTFPTEDLHSPETTGRRIEGETPLRARQHVNEPAAMASKGVSRALACWRYQRHLSCMLIQRRYWFDIDAKRKTHDKPIVSRTNYQFVKSHVPVVLLESIRGVGVKGQIVHVKRGYARHVLVPKGLALFGTWENIDEHADPELIADPTIKARVATERGQLPFDWVDDVRLRFVRPAREDQAMLLLEPVTVMKKAMDKGRERRLAQPGGAQEAPVEEDGEELDDET
eukprot:g20947.t1